MTADPLSPFLVIWAPILGLALAAGCAMLLWACLAAAADADRAREELDGLFNCENTRAKTGHTKRSKINGLWVVSRDGTRQVTKARRAPQWVVVRRDDPTRARS